MLFSRWSRSLIGAVSLVLVWASQASATKSQLVGVCEHPDSDAKAMIYAVYGSEGLAQVNISVNVKNDVWETFPLVYVRPWLSGESLEGTLARIEGALKGDSRATGSEILSLNGEAQGTNNVATVDISTDGEAFDFLTVYQQMHFVECRLVDNKK